MIHRAHRASNGHARGHQLCHLPPVQICRALSRSFATSFARRRMAESGRVMTSDPPPAHPSTPPRGLVIPLVYVAAIPSSRIVGRDAIIKTQCRRSPAVASNVTVCRRRRRRRLTQTRHEPATRAPVETRRCPSSLGHRRGAARRRAVTRHARRVRASINGYRRRDRSTVRRGQTDG